MLARFVPVVRTFTPIIAGVSTMHYRTFFVYNLIGGFLWTATFSYAGYYIGQKLHEMGFNIEIISIVIILISVAPIAIHAVPARNADRHSWRRSRTAYDHPGYLYQGRQRTVVFPGLIDYSTADTTGTPSWSRMSAWYFIDLMDKVRVQHVLRRPPGRQCRRASSP